MPRPKKPHNLKVVAGTARPDRDGPPLVDLPLVEDYPPPPDWLPNAHAIREWDRAVPILMNQKLLTEAALTTLGHMCAVHGQIVQQYTAGLAPNASMYSQYRGLANDFGLTPVAQGKVRPHGEAASENEFARNGRKPAAPAQ